MSKEKRKIDVGDYVKITQKNGKSSQGMVRSILRDNKNEQIVELFYGETGRVERRIPRKPVTPIKKRAKPLESVLLKKEKLKEKDLFSDERKDLEFKTSALWSQDLKKEEIENIKTPEIKKYGNRASKIIVAKVIAGFLNSSGGDLVIGVKEGKDQGSKNTIVGIDSEFSKLKNKDFGEDGYKRMIMDDIIRPYFPKTIFNHFNDFLHISFLKKEGKTLCRVNVKKSDSEVFIAIAKDEHFFIRVDTQTRELKGKEMIDYIRRRFK